MSSRLFTCGCQYGTDSLYAITVGTWDFTPTERQAEVYMDALRAYIIEQMEALDDRLWWQPETSEIFLEDDGSERPLLSESDFDDWWNDTISAAIECIKLPNAQ